MRRARCGYDLDTMNVTLKPFDFAQAVARAGLNVNGMPLAKGPKAVEGGYEWDGCHRRVTPTPFEVRAKPPLGWWEWVFEEVEPAAVVSSSPLPGFETWRTFEYESIWPPHRRRIYVLRPGGGR